MAWKLTIDTTGTSITAGGAPNVWVVTGTGPMPLLVDLTPPPDDPIDPPPPDEPVGDPFAPLPGEDTSPFVFPEGGPRHDAVGSDRQYTLSMDAPVCWWFRANVQGAGNPGQLRWAGLIAADGRTDYGRAVGEHNLWVLVKTDFEDPLTGKPVSPPAGHLIRRALLRGRV